MLKIARTIEWYKQNYESILKPYKADLSFIKISGRQRKSFERITYFLNLYSNDEHEFKQLVNMLLKCYYDYENMVKNNISLNTYEEPDVKIKDNAEFEQLHPEVIDLSQEKEIGFVANAVNTAITPQSLSPLEIQKVKPLEFIKSKGNNGEIGIDEFLNAYDEETLNRLLRQGDVFKPKMNLIKVLE